MEETEFTRDEILKFLATLGNELTNLCGNIKKEISTVEDNYDKVEQCLEKWKNQSLTILQEVSNTTLNKKPIVIEEKIVEWNKTYKLDPEISKVIQKLVILLSDWKEYVKLHISKNPLLTINEYSKYEEIKKAAGK